MQPTACFSFLYFDFCMVSFISLCLSAAVARTWLRFKVASEDAATVVVVMELGARHCLTTFDSFVNFGRQKHSQGWGREIDPERCPELRPKRRAKRSGRIHAHAGNWRLNADVNYDEHTRK